MTKRSIDQIAELMDEADNNDVQSQSDIKRARGAPPKVVFYGESGVGKSSTINVLLALTAEGEGGEGVKEIARWNEEDNLICPEALNFLVPLNETPFAGTNFATSIEYGPQYSTQVTFGTVEELRTLLCEKEFRWAKQSLFSLFVDGAPTCAFYDLEWKTSGWLDKMNRMTPNEIVFRPEVVAELTKLSSYNIVPPEAMCKKEQRLLVRKGLERLLLNPRAYLESLRCQSSSSSSSSAINEQAVWMDVLAHLMIKSVTVTAPCRILRHVTLVDTPGDGDTNSKRKTETIKAIQQADIILCMLSMKNLSVSGLYTKLLTPADNGVSAGARIRMGQTALWMVRSQKIYADQPDSIQYMYNKCLKQSTINDANDVLQCAKVDKNALAIRPRPEQDVRYFGYVWPTLAVTFTNEAEEKMANFFTLLGHLVNRSPTLSEADAFLKGKTITGL